MVRASKVVVVVAAFVAVCHLRSHVFVAPPSRKALAVAPAAGFMACLTSAAPAYADRMDDAADKLAASTYKFLGSIPWTSKTFATLPEVNDPIRLLKLIDKCLIMGAAMDPLALKDGAFAHIKAISSIDSKGLTTQEDYAGIIKAIGYMIGSVRPQRAMDVFDAGMELLPQGSETGKYILTKLNPDDARDAYRALIEFAQIVRFTSEA